MIASATGATEPSGSAAVPVTTGSFVLGESPVWSTREQRLYFVDVRRPALHRLEPSSGRLETWVMPEIIAAVVLRSAGGVVLSLRSGLYVFEPSTATLLPLLPVAEDHAENRLNDTRCDRAGRIWLGTMCDFGRRTTGTLYRVSTDLQIARLRANITIPNALCFAPDDRTIYFADTAVGVIERADVDITSGEIGPWRNFAMADAAPGRPDGATIDAEGYVWNARVGAGCLARFASDGRLERLVRLPTSMPTSCAFGGPDLSTLFVTTATQGLSREELGQQPMAGRVLALQPGVRGVAEPCFAG